MLTKIKDFYKNNSIAINSGILCLAFFFRQAVAYINPRYGYFLAGNFDVFFIFGVIYLICHHNQMSRWEWLAIAVTYGYLLLQIILLPQLNIIKALINITKIVLCYFVMKESILLFKNKKIDLKYITILFGILCLVFITLALIMQNNITLWRLNDTINKFDLTRLQLFFTEPGELGMSCSIILILAVYFLTKAKKKILYSLIAVLPTALCLLLTKSMGGILVGCTGIAAVLIGNLIFNPSRRKTIIFLSVASVALIACVLIITFTKNSIFLRLVSVFNGTDSSTRYRITTSFRVAVQAIIDTKGLGLGFGNTDLPAAVSQYSHYGLTSAGIINSFAEFIAAGGIFSILCISLLTLALVKTSLQNKDASSLGLTMFLVCYQMVGAYFCFPLFWFFYGYILKDNTVMTLLNKQNNIKTKFLIIGGGITGLAFANQVDDYMLVEREARCGGYCKTITKNGFVWDYAGHFFHFKNPKIKKEFLSKIDQQDLVQQNKKTAIYYKGRLIDYPFQKNIHQLPKREFQKCLNDLLNKTEKEKYDSFLDMLYGKFGKGIVEKFLRPYNEKLYACDLNSLDQDAMGRFFPYANVQEIIQNTEHPNNSSYNDTFLYPKHGAEVFVKVLLEQLDPKRIYTNTSVESIDYEQKIALLSNGKKIEYQYLINTTPLNNFLDFFNEEYRQTKQLLSYNQVLVFNLGFNKKSPRYIKEHWLYFPDKKINFYRVGFYDNILNNPDKLSIYVEIGFNHDEKIDIQQQLQETLKNLQKVGIISQDMQLEESCHIIMNPAYVHINTETEKSLKSTFKDLAKHNIYTIGRYGAWCYCSIEDCIISAQKLARKLKAKRS